MRVLLAAAVLTACGPSNRDPGATDAPSQADAPGGSDGTVVDPSLVYAHSGQTLYQMNNLTLATTTIGSMTGLGTQSLTDIAIDKNNRMLGVTLDKLYEIDPTTGAATFIKNLTGTGNATSLSFIPSDLNDPASDDILVTADSFGKVLQIDTTTGTSTEIGNYGTTQSGDQIKSSGDLFGVRGVGIYATVDVGDTPGNDFLAKIDPVTWKATLIGGGTGFDKIFGLGYWSGQIFGFVDMGANSGGKMIQIDINTGVGTELSQSSQRWFGAGVTTNAPIF